MMLSAFHLCSVEANLWFAVSKAVFYVKGRRKEQRSGLYKSFETPSILQVDNMEEIPVEKNSF